VCEQFAVRGSGRLAAAKSGQDKIAVWAWSVRRLITLRRRDLAIDQGPNAQR
jgi:hypothetical protein